MARMVPFPMLPTESSAERRLYEGFLSQLADEYVVYHSIDWILGPEKAGDPVIQGEADFVIAHPIDGVLVLEVKGGQIAYDPATRRWTQKGRSGIHRLDEDPFHQARDEMHSLVEILRHQPGWARWRPSFGYGVGFPDGLYEQDAHPGAPARCAIDRDDMDRLAKRVPEVMGVWKRRGRRFGEQGMEALDRALGMRVEVRTPLHLQFGEEDRKILGLTDDQRYILSYVTRLHRAAIVGLAGTGKTMLAVAIAKRLAAGGRRTLLTCFNRRLAGWLRESTAETPHIDVFHFHDLCVRMAEEAGIPVPPGPSEPPDGSSYFDQELPSLLGQAADALGPRYSAIVVDEAQDFRPNWWPPLMKLHTGVDTGALFVFADDNQNLYGGALPKDLVDMEFALPANLRNTRPIHEFVSVFYRGEGGMEGRGPEGRPVEVLGYRDSDDLARLLRLVLRNLEGEGVPPDDIVVLTPSRAAKSALRQRGQLDGFRLADRPEPGAILASTIHAFNGLERPVVILAEIGERHQEDLARYLYVGGSRARNHLIILAAEPVARELRVLAGVAKP